VPAYDWYGAYDNALHQVRFSSSYPALDSQMYSLEAQTIKNEVMV